MDGRDKSIDVLKGIGIILVVVGHTYCPFVNFIYLFHMPIFFMAAGYCMSNRYTDDIHGVKSVIIKRLKSLWLPYFAFNSVFLLLNNLFIEINIYTTNDSFLNAPTGNGFGLGKIFDTKELLDRLIHALLFNRSTQLTGPSWFLEVLFFVTILYVMIDFTLKTVLKGQNKLIEYVNIVVAIVLFAIGYFLREFPLFTKYRASTILVVLILFEMGIWVKRIRLSAKAHLIISIACFFALLKMSYFGFVELSENSFTSPLFLIVASILGWYMIYGISKGISSCSQLSRIRSALCFLGRNTIPIIFLHCLCFKPITFLQVKIFNLPDYMLAAFPVLYNDGVWWVLYSLCSLVLCLIIIAIWKSVKKKVSVIVSNTYTKYSRTIR